MKKQLLTSVLALAFAAHFAIAQTDKQALIQLKPTATENEAALRVASRLTSEHYKAMPLDDAMSEKIFDRYFKALDGEKLFFTQADVAQFESSRTKLDDAIKDENLSVPFAIFNVYQKRYNERYAYGRELLVKGKFDFTVDESLPIDREKAAWPKSDDEARDLWRKRVKNDWLRLKLAGRDDKSIRETLDKRYETAQSAARKNTADDVFQLFMNAYTSAIEPHTNYFLPRTADQFDISMRLSLEGIGAVLQQRDDYTIIRELVVGSPAENSGKLKVGDRIVAVAQGDAGPMVDIVGWRIDDVVGLVRGAKDSQVRLDILPASAGLDGKHTIVPLVRKKIMMEDQAAKKSIIEVKDGAVKRRIGVVSLPVFYLDFDAARRGDKDYKSATRDVARILGELKKDKVDSVLVDLRNNGGGSLIEAIELTGLFIDKGPVVQQRNAAGRIDVSSDTNSGLEWDGPLAVLINRGSASASEIFAAAIQDYGRGLIIGEPSFGKGTVQSLMRMDQARYGELKMTSAQFFRVNGGTTQLRGVTPDVKLPATSDPELFGESSYDNALPWTSIKPANYVPAGDLKAMFAPLQHRTDLRVAKDKDFVDLQDDLNEYHKMRKENAISLNETVRRKERDVIEARNKARTARLAAHTAGGDDVVLVSENADTHGKAAPAVKPVKQVKGATRADDGLRADERDLASELAEEKAAKNAKDVMLNEAARVMSDEVGILHTDTRLALHAMPYLPLGKEMSN